MNIFKNNFKRILRKKSSIIFMFVLPIFSMIFSIVVVNNSLPLTVGVVDYDNTELSKFLITSIESSCKVVLVEEDSINDKLINLTIDFAIKIPEGFTEDIISNKEPKISTYKIKETEATTPLDVALNNNINAAKNIARVAEEDYMRFYEGLELYKNGKFNAEYKTIEGTDRTQDKLLQSFGFIVMFMMYLSNNAARLMLEDKRYKTYSRIFSSPITAKSYMLENVLSSMAIIGIQVTLVLIIAIKVFNLFLGSSILGVVLLLALFGVCSVAMAVAINNFSRNLGQSSVLSQFIILAVSYLGGCFWPREIMPSFLQQLGRFVPSTWVLEGIEKQLLKPDMNAIYLEMSILALFSLAFFLIGLCRKNSVEI